MAVSTDDDKMRNVATGMLDRISFWWKQLVLPPKAVNPIDSKEIDQFYILCRNRNTIPTKDELI